MMLLVALVTEAEEWTKRCEGEQNYWQSYRMGCGRVRRVGVGVYNECVLLRARPFESCSNNYGHNSPEKHLPFSLTR